jgi:hypothetical protein
MGAKTCFEKIDRMNKSSLTSPLQKKKKKKKKKKAPSLILSQSQFDHNHYHLSKLQTSKPKFYFSFLTFDSFNQPPTTMCLMLLIAIVVLVQSQPLDSGQYNALMDVYQKIGA